MPSRNGFWEVVFRFDRGKILPWIALRNAIGVALPLAVAAAIHNPGGGLVITTGALNVSFSDGADPYRHRARRMLASSLCCGLAVFAGGLCGRIHWVAALLAAVCAFVAGMITAIGTTATDLATITLVTLLVYSAQSMTPKRALIAGLLAFGGGLLQAALALALWPVRRLQPERRALSALFAELARAAESGAPATEAPPASEASTAAQTALAGLRSDDSVDAERVLALLTQAERTRLGLMMLFRLRVRIGRDPEIAASGEVLDRAMKHIAELLRATSVALLSKDPVERPSDLAELRSLAGALRGKGGMVEDARSQIDAVTGQLRSALELAGHATVRGAAEFAAREASQPWYLRVAGGFAVLRANLRFESAAFRHAVRLAVCIAIGEAAGRAFSSPRAYWLTMTIALVLKPDFTSTFSRGVLRLAGTILGILIATALFHYLSPAPGVEVAFIAVFAFLLRCYGPANYGVFVTALTALVVFLFAVSGVAPGQVMAARGINTIAGGLLSLVAYRLWPTWEHTQVKDALARMFDAYRVYYATVREAYLHPERRYAAQLDRARLAARLARSNLEASVTRLRTEPGVPPERLASVEKLLANSHRLIHAVMSMEAGLYRSRPAPVRVAFAAFSDAVDVTLAAFADQKRPLRETALPDLRELHTALLQTGDPREQRYALINVETDRVTNSLNTLAKDLAEA